MPTDTNALDRAYAELRRANDALTAARNAFYTSDLPNLVQRGDAYRRARREYFDAARAFDAAKARA